MKELVKIQTNVDGKQAVSARNMYLGLGLEPAHWKRWATKNIEKNIFAEQGKDWQGFTLMVNGNETKDYVLTLDFAKKLSMQVRTEQGEKVRNYFIAVERIALEANTQLATSKEVRKLIEKVHQLEASITTTKVNDFTIWGYAQKCKIRIYGREAVNLGKLATKHCKEQKEPVYDIPDPRFGTVHTYPEHILKQTFEEFFKQPRF